MNRPAAGCHALLALSLSVLMLMPGPALADIRPQSGLSKSNVARQSGKRLSRTRLGEATRPSQKNPTPLSEHEKIVHVLSRLTFGTAPDDIKNVEAMGVDKYIEQQLHPEAITEARSVLDFVSTSDALTKDPDHLFVEYGPPAIAAARAELNVDPKSDEGKKAIGKIRNDFNRKVMDDTFKAKVLRAAESPRQLQEVMTEFWYNHFNIYSGKGTDNLWVGAYEEQAIRPYALGKFRDLVGSTCHHAAMLFYLDNWQNSSPDPKRKNAGLNENYARELMELHTLGVDGGYSQQDVIQLAHILTGLTTAVHAANGELKSPTNALGSYFNDKRHDFGDKVLLGQTIKGVGEGEIDQSLDMLCRHPSTAHHICFQLAQYFVNDMPPKALVDRLSARFLKTDGDIGSVLSTLFHSPEFWDRANTGVKFKSPLRYVVSVLRATEARPDDYKSVQQYLRQQGQPLYGCLTPDGYKNVKEAWLNPDALMHRANFAVDFTQGRFKGVNPGPIEVADLQETLGLQFAPATSDVIGRAPTQLKPALLLGSPEFMLY